MTTRLKGLTVAFEKDIREDDAQRIIDAVAMLRGVLQVGPIEVGDNWISEVRIRRDLEGKLFAVLREEKRT